VWQPKIWDPVVFMPPVTFVVSMRIDTAVDCAGSTGSAPLSTPVVHGPGTGRLFCHEVRRWQVAARNVQTLQPSSSEQKAQQEDVFTTPLMMQRVLEPPGSFGHGISSPATKHAGAVLPPLAHTLATAAAAGVARSSARSSRLLRISLQIDAIAAGGGRPRLSLLLCSLLYIYLRRRRGAHGHSIRGALAGAPVHVHTVKLGPGAPLALVGAGGDACSSRASM
jgi:hypothetical protein